MRKPLRSKDTLTITISDVNGSKSYTIAQVFKKYALYFGMTVSVILIISVILIKMLYSEVNDLNVKKDRLKADFDALKEQNIGLTEDIAIRQQELDSLNEKIEDVEAIIGIDNTDNDNSLERVDIAKVTLIEKKYLLSIIPNGYPIANRGVTNNYGWRMHPVLKKRNFHSGIDLKASMRTKIYAPANGIIKYAGYNNKGYGYMIIISHNFGFETLYAHLYKVKVKVGDVINKKQFIGLTGNSGLSSGPHLHYEVRYAQRVLNPTYFLKWNMKNYEKIFQKEKKVKWQSLIDLMRLQMRILQQQS